MEKTKEYEAVMLLGITTDTQDMEGKVLSRKEEEAARIPGEALEKVLRSFRGSILQLPPMYSALKVGGKKLVDLARSGKEIERKKREVVIHSLEWIGGEIPRVFLRISCSRGTYIRTLCHDIGEALGVGAVMEKLVRTRSGSFQIKDALTLSEIERYKREGGLEQVIKPVDAFFPSLPKKIVPEQLMKPAKNGNVLPLSALTDKTEPAGEMGRRLGKEASLPVQTLFFEELTVPHKDCLLLYDEENGFLGIYESDKKEGLVKPHMLFFGETNDGMD